MYWRHIIFINEADEHNNAGSLRPRAYSSVPSFQASTPYSLESESLRMDCIMSGGVSPTLAINAVTNKVRHHLLGDDRLVLSVTQFSGHTGFGLCTHAG